MCIRDRFGYLLFVGIGLFTIRPFFEMFTDSPAILEDACMYTYICVFLCFGCFFHILIEKVFQSMGKMIFPMAIQAAGAIVNIILDPIMIFGLQMCIRDRWKRISAQEIS